jgi:hypothetical protein
LPGLRFVVMCTFCDSWLATRMGDALRKQAILILAVLAVLTALDAGTTKFVFTWMNPNYTGTHFKTILVLGINGKVENRAEFEDRLSAAITRPGIVAIPSYSLLPRPNSMPLDMDQLRLPANGTDRADRNELLFNGQAGWGAYLDRNQRLDRSAFAAEGD